MKKFDIEQQRKAFDEWALKHQDNLDLTAYEENIMFDAWIAARQQDGYVMVPVKPTLETMQKMNREFIDSKFDTPKRRMQQVYKAIIQAVQE